MWPYSDRELDWLTRQRPDRRVPALGDRGLIAFHVARGHQLRARFLARLLRSAVAGLRRRFAARSARGSGHDTGGLAAVPR